MFDNIYKERERDKLFFFVKNIIFFTHTHTNEKSAINIVQIAILKYRICNI